MTEENSKEGFLDNLKTAGQNLGEVVSDFASRLSDERARPNQGGEDGLERLREAASEAREKLTGARDAESVKNVTRDFAATAQSVGRDLIEAVGRAADGTRDSEAFDRVRTAFGDVVDGVRGAANETAEKVKQASPHEPAPAQEQSDPAEPKRTVATQPQAQSGNDDFNRTLDELMTDLRGGADPRPATIDGEVVSESDEEK